MKLAWSGNRAKISSENKVGWPGNKSRKPGNETLSLGMKLRWSWNEARTPMQYTM